MYRIDSTNLSTVLINVWLLNIQRLIKKLQKKYLLKI